MRLIIETFDALLLTGLSGAAEARAQAIEGCVFGITDGDGVTRFIRAAMPACQANASASAMCRASAHSRTTLELA